MQYCFFSNRQKGFTIIELMIAVLIIAMISVIAVPNFRDLVERKKIKSNVTKVSQIFIAARSEAVVNSAGRTLVCWNPETTNVDVNDTTIKPNMIVYMVDEDNDLTTEQVIYGEAALVADSLTVTDNQADGGIGANCISYTSIGRLDNNSETTLGFIYCRDSLQSDGDDSNDNDGSFRVEVALSGRAAIKDNSKLNGAGVDTTGLGTQDC